MSTKGQRTRKEIVEAAKTLFYHKGYTNTSFSDIVDKTNIRRGNINHYFKTKNDILEAVIDQRIADYKSLFSEWEIRYSDPKDRLRCFVQMV
ncbi:MAG TPA: TetR/AcrR family transcriptional regulator, partial [Gammaproteobacteria bacterium]|nr:TetR/AcrR family transcriptional regulator [Gammaproteobacteria bacterium]